MYAEETGEGQQIDISIAEYATNILENALMQYSYSGQEYTRVGNRGYGRAAWGIYPCNDGFVGIIAGPDHRWPEVARIMEREELADPRFASRRGRQDNADEVDALMLPWLIENDKVDIFKAGQESGLGFSFVATMQDILEMEQLIAREYFVELDHPEAGTLRYPGAPIACEPEAPRPGISDARPCSGSTRRRFCQTGWDTTRVTGYGTQSRPRASGGYPMLTPTTKQPLKNYRILDLSRIWAGPYCTKLMADLGAEVIKMESLSVYDSHRGPISPARGIAAYPDGEPGEEPWNRNGWFNCLHMSKYGITLELTSDEGRRVFEQLVSISDVLIENFRQGSLERLGYDYAELRKHRPDLIYVSMPAFGNTGPWKGYLGYGIGQEQLSGMAHLTGYPNDGPMKSGINHGDPITGSHAAGVLLAALRRRRRTGKGMYIDVSQQESSVALMGGELLAYQMTGEEPERIGNRSRWYAPCNTYPCSGEDRWITIAATNDGEWVVAGLGYGRQPAWRQRRAIRHLGRGAHCPPGRPRRHHRRLDKRARCLRPGRTSAGCRCSRRSGAARAGPAVRQALQRPGNIHQRRSSPGWAPPVSGTALEDVRHPRRSAVASAHAGAAQPRGIRRAAGTDWQGHRFTGV